jgi:probable FeS assembly SUF system protein SufT
MATGDVVTAALVPTSRDMLASASTQALTTAPSRSGLARAQGEMHVDNAADGRHQDVLFERDCNAIIIPDGFHVNVPQGTSGVIMQVLGGHYTVRVDTGYLVRIEGVDGDAIGLAVDPTLLGDPDGEVDEERVLEILATCYDPEIPVNIVDLGLIYGVDIIEEDDGIKAVIQMTLTAPGCGMGQVLQDDIRRKLLRLGGVVEVDVELVFDPPWSMEKMSESARLELGML